MFGTKKYMCNGKYGGCPVEKTAKVLLIIGGLNWGLVGVRNVDYNGVTGTL